MNPTWRTSLAVFIGFLQIQALISTRSTSVTGTEGQKFDFKCEYSIGQENNIKYFWHVKDNELQGEQKQINKSNQWETKGRFSLYDNTSGVFFIVRVDKLYLNDSGTYWCGVRHNYWPDDIRVIQLNVSKDFSLITDSTMNPPSTQKLTMQLFLVAVLCVTAILFVCMFTLFLLMIVKQRRSDPPKKRQTSSEYEMMNPSVQTKTEPCCCSRPDCTGLPAPPWPPAPLHSNLTSHHRESTVSDYADVEVPAHVCQYQHLDPSQQEEHVYHSIHVNCNLRQTIH